ncbi:MAG: hypothetical protein M3Q81_05485, partial [bacterium]|nr:hypothetical protein [bacterium]
IAAIVTEQSSFSATLLSFFRAQAIPVIGNAKNVTKRVHQHQSITVDATNGKVFANDSISFAKTGDITTRLYAAVGNPELLATAVPHVDGVICHLEWQLMKEGLHPQAIINNNQSSSFITNWLQKLEPELLTSQTAVLYKLSQLDSLELLSLKHGNRYETAEENPLLGYRGATRYLRATGLLDFELQAVLQLQKTLKRSISIVVPFTRAPWELELLNKKITAWFSHSVWQPALWWEISTLENLFNLSAYLMHNPQGIYVNLKQIHALCSGIDPSQVALMSQYPLTRKTVEFIVNSFTSSMKSAQFEVPANILFQLDEGHTEILEVLIDAGFSITVASKQASVMKQRLLDIEQTNKEFRHQ